MKMFIIVWGCSWPVKILPAFMESRGLAVYATGDIVSSGSKNGAWKPTPQKRPKYRMSYEDRTACGGDPTGAGKVS